MFGVNFLAHAIGFGLPILALALLVGAGAAYYYVPLFGKQLAVGLIAFSAATFAYDLGFERRAALDKSATLEVTIAGLKTTIADLKNQAVEAAGVAADARMAEQNAEDHAAINQEKVDQYVTELAKRPTPACGLTDDDVGRLRGIGATRHGVPPKPATRPLDLRPPDPRSDPP